MAVVDHEHDEDMGDEEMPWDLPPPELDGKDPRTRAALERVGQTSWRPAPVRLPSRDAS